MSSKRGGKREGAGRYDKSPLMTILKAKITCPHCKLSSIEVMPYAGYVFHCPVCSKDSRIAQKMKIQASSLNNDAITLKPNLPSFDEARRILKDEGHQIRAKSGDNDNAYLDGDLIPKSEIMMFALKTRNRVSKK